MPDPIAQRLQRAWEQVWSEEHGRDPARAAVRPDLSLPDVDPVPLFGLDERTSAALGLHASTLSVLSTAELGPVQYDPATRAVTVRVALPAMMVLGGYRAVRHASGGAAAVAQWTLGRTQPPGDPRSQAQQNLDQAKAYRKQLVAQDAATQSGPAMVQAYYEHNLAYSELFALASIQVQWTTHTTNGRDSAFYATHTANCADSPDANLNGQPDDQGYSDYNAHSFWQQTMVMNGCYAAHDHYQSTDPDKAARYQAAGDAASGFQGQALAPSKSPQTVNSVMDLTRSTPPPEMSAAELADQAQAQSRPAWLAQIEADAAQTYSAVRHELQLRDSLPAPRAETLQQGTYGARLHGVELELAGTLGADGTVTFDRSAATIAGVGLALDGAATPATRDAELRRRLQAAVAQAPVLGQIVRERARIALAGPEVREGLGQLMTFALAHPGQVGGARQQDDPSEAAYINNMVQGLLPQLNDPTSPYNLTHTIQTQTQYDPQADPYVGFSAGPWSLGYLPGQAGTEGAQNICTAIQPFGEVYIPPPPPGNTPNIELSELLIENLSQATVVSLSAVGPDDAIVINAAIEWGTRSAHGFAGIRINGRFSLTQLCCSAPDGVHCTANTTSSNQGTGTFTLVMPQANALAQLPITALAPGELTLGLSSLTFQADLSRMNITVQIDDIANKEQWQKHAEQILNDPATLSMIVGEMQAQLLDDFSQIAQALTQNIDDYLQATHQYPYDNAGQAMY